MARVNLPLQRYKEKPIDERCGFYIKGRFTGREIDPSRQNSFSLSLHAEIFVRVITK